MSDSPPDGDDSLVATARSVTDRIGPLVAAAGSSLKERAVAKTGLCDPRTSFPASPGREWFPEDAPYSVEDVETMLDGAHAWPLTDWSHTNDRPQTSCSYCETDFTLRDHPRVGVYVTDTLAVPPPDWAWEECLPVDRPLHPLTIYCLDCASPQLLFPCAQATDLRVFATLHPDYTMTDLYVTDVSVAGDGFSWDPLELYEALRDEPVQQETVAGGLGPEDVVLEFLQTVKSVDLGQLIAADGSLRAGPLETAQAEFDACREQMPADAGKRPAYRARNRRLCSTRLYPELDWLEPP